MGESGLIAALAAAVALFFWLALSYVRYRATYRYDDEDLRQARRDATRRSRSALGGRASEQLVPMLPEFCERFDPADARFLGAPIDYVVFDGLVEGALRDVVLVEVKSGRSKLSQSERDVERAGAEGRVSFEVIRVP